MFREVGFAGERGCGLVVSLTPTRCVVLQITTLTRPDETGYSNGECCFECREYDTQSNIHIIHIPCTREGAFACAFCELLGILCIGEIVIVAIRSRSVGSASTSLPLPRFRRLVRDVLPSCPHNYDVHKASQQRHTGYYVVECPCVCVCDDNNPYVLFVRMCGWLNAPHINRAVKERKRGNCVCACDMNKLRAFVCVVCVSVCR